MKRYGLITVVPTRRALLLSSLNDFNFSLCFYTLFESFRAQSIKGKCTSRHLFPYFGLRHILPIVPHKSTAFFLIVPIVSLFSKCPTFFPYFSRRATHLLHTPYFSKCAIILQVRHIFNKSGKSLQQRSDFYHGGTFFQERHIFTRAAHYYNSGTSLQVRHIYKRAAHFYESGAILQ